MARLPDCDDDADAQLATWLRGRPSVIQAMVARTPPGRLYRLTTSGHRVYVYSYDEDGTLTVVVDGRYNAVLFERRVFGIRPEDLVECALPEPHELVGSADIPIPVMQQLHRGEIAAVCADCRLAWGEACAGLGHHPYRWGSPGPGRA